MAISARLSRILHITFGEDAASDMVSWMQSVDDHRAELRELNELNAARIDARFAQVDARFAQVDARFGQMEAQIGQVEARLGARIAQVDARIDLVAKGLEMKIDQRFADTIKWSFLFWCGAMAAMFWKG